SPFLRVSAVKSPAKRAKIKLPTPSQGIKDRTPMKTLFCLVALLAAALMLTTDKISADDKAASSSSAAPSRTAPPMAKKVHTENHVNGGALVDDYRWLREKSNPEVAQYLEQENAYAAAVMQPSEALQKKLYDEMVSHIKETDTSVPYRRGDYFYYSRWEAGKQYQIYGRKKAAANGSLNQDAPEQVTVDVNELAKGEKFMSLGNFQPSGDGNLLAYTTDNTGFRQFRLHVRDLRTGKDLPETAERVGSVAWAADNKTLFYTIEDQQTKRQYRLYRHTLSADSSKDVLVYEEPDEKFNIGVAKTRSQKYLVL